MTLPIRKGKTIVTRDAAFEALKGQINEQAHKCTAPVKAALGERSDAFIKRSNDASKSFSAKVLPNPVAHIAEESINTAEPISQKAAQVVINTGINLTTNKLVNKTVDWATKHKN
ncbi:hypothetical protein RHABOEDO_000206 [Candidatus Rhabdochlamydia oedothoracis]|uniref:Uncharacterized protein n=1 Tax=Candidatus Rhabdochlamydia oedothoracis TaxID=2720720 RepID=A0ABX8UZQ5_9BACT|nr:MULTISPECIES: hypothetical protein [Rhabdochlamydia]KAG6559958.1 hypothetical protein RHOW815_000039 [Candidatus Rhabdochlamydia sp. W815]QYF48106.1 hypothetical protein RHABOEDO_000206 [Candidatus Rhabdochlamydia oedothoracis]